MENSAIEKLIENEKEWRRHLVQEMEIVRCAQIQQGISIAKLKIKAGIWGIIGGSIPTSAALIVAFLKSKY